MTEEMFIQTKDCKLHARLVGRKTDKPTIIMEAGYGDSSSTWDSIIKELSAISQVLIYDRAGLGKSEASPNLRTSFNMVLELRELLSEMNLEPPYLLVGHSFGGGNMRIFTSEFQSEVCGLVLVDSTPEDYRERFLPTMSASFQDTYKKQFVHESNYNEFMESLLELKETRVHLELPVIVLCAGKKAHYSGESQELWNIMQGEIAKISANAELIIAERSAHYIQNDEPNLIISVVKKLIDDR